MRRLLTIAALQDLACVALFSVLLLFMEADRTAWLNLLGLVFAVLLTPLGWVGLWLVLSLGLLLPRLPFIVPLVASVAFLPNALLWSAAICWWLNRRARTGPLGDTEEAPD